MARKVFRLVALVGALLVVGSASAPKAWAAGLCRIWCDNGITVEGYSNSFEECMASFAGNCNQQGTYGGTFCYEGYPCQTY